MVGNVQPEFKMEFEIRSFDVDASCTAHLPVFCKYMQEAAYYHAESFGLGHTQLAQLNMAWVLSRMRIEVERLPKWGETVTLRTWPSGKDRLFYYRDFEITDGDGQLLLLASTAWFIIDIEKRERALPTWWVSSAMPIGPKVFDSKIARLKSCGCSEGELMRVNYGDLDLNGHVSNIRYVEWILNRLPLEFHHQNAIQSLDVNYLAEAVYGHEVSVCTSEGEPMNFCHSIMANGLDLFRAISKWDAR